MGTRFLPHDLRDTLGIIKHLQLKLDNMKEERVVGQVKSSQVKTVQLSIKCKSTVATAVDYHCINNTVHSVRPAVKNITCMCRPA